MEETSMLEALKMFWALMDPVVIGLVLLSGYFSGKYLTGIWLDKHVSVAWRTLLVSAVFTALYVIFLKRDGGAFEYTKLFVSYVTATSMYELIIKTLGNYIPGFKTTQQTMNKTVFWDIQNINTDTIVSIPGSNYTGSISGLVNSDPNFTFVQENGTNATKLAHDGLTPITIQFHNGTASYPVTSEVCDWAGVRPVRRPR